MLHLLSSLFFVVALLGAGALVVDMLRAELARVPIQPAVARRMAARRVRERTRGAVRVRLSRPVLRAAA